MIDTRDEVGAIGEQIRCLGELSQKFPARREEIFAMQIDLRDRADGITARTHAEIVNRIYHGTR